MEDTPKADTASTPEEGPREKQSLLTLVPRLAKFLYHLAADERVPWTVKAALGGLAVYLVSPVDIIPDAVPGGGYLDDLLLLSFVANFVLAKVPPYRDTYMRAEVWASSVTPGVAFEAPDSQIRTERPGGLGGKPQNGLEGG